MTGYELKQVIVEQREEIQQIMEKEKKVPGKNVFKGGVTFFLKVW